MDLGTRFQPGASDVEHPPLFLGPLLLTSLKQLTARTRVAVRVCARVRSLLLADFANAPPTSLLCVAPPFKSLSISAICFVDPRFYAREKYKSLLMETKVPPGTTSRGSRSPLQILRHFGKCSCWLKQNINMHLTWGLVTESCVSLGGNAVADQEVSQAPSGVGVFAGKI